MEKRKESRKSQLFLKGTRIAASVLWYDMQANDMTPGELAEDFGLSLAAVKEALAYCKANMSVIEEDAQRERSELRKAGLPI